MPKKQHGMKGKRNAYRGGPSTKVRSISFPAQLYNSIERRMKSEKKTFSAIVVGEFEK